MNQINFINWLHRIFKYVLMIVLFIWCITGVGVFLSTLNERVKEKEEEREKYFKVRIEIGEIVQTNRLIGMQIRVNKKIYAFTTKCSVHIGMRVECIKIGYYYHVIGGINE